MVPPMGAAAGAATVAGAAVAGAAVAGAAAAKLADAKNSKSPDVPLNVVFVSTDHINVRWGVYKSHYRSMRKFVEDCKARNPLPPRPYDAAVNNCPSYYIKGM